MVVRCNDKMYNEESAYELVSSSDIAEVFKEPFILTGYRRPGQTARESINTMCQLHNETCNVYTHLVPALYFSALLAYYVIVYPDLLKEPVAIYWASIILYMFMSAVAHQFNNVSVVARDFCFFIDYLAISLYSYGSAVAYLAYSIPTDWRDTIFAHIYLPVALLMAGCSTGIACITRVSDNSFLRNTGRVFAYTLPYFFVTIPILYRCCTETSSTADVHTRVFFFTAISAFFYSSHVPERWLPFQCDIFFHSHSLFHCFGVLATYGQLQALLMDSVASPALKLGAFDYNYELPILTGSFLGLLMWNTATIFLILFIALIPEWTHAKVQAVNARLVASIRLKKA